MATPHMLLASLLIALTAGKVAAVNGEVNSLGCSVGFCCNDNGVCTTWNDGGSCGFDASLDTIVTDSFFNEIKNTSSSSSSSSPDCPGIDFYSRSAFLEASAAYPEFGATGTEDVHVQEIAAFFAHVALATGSFCYVEAINRLPNCEKSSEWPCNATKQYYGRGPIQLTLNVNYGPAGRSIGFDGINDPEIVANDPVISFKTAIWFWMNNVHSNFTSGQGFGATIRAIDEGECDGGDKKVVRERVQFYTQYCKQLGVTPGVNLSC